MTRAPRALVVLMLGAAAACGGSSSSGDDQGAIDAAPADGGIGCAATDPRQGATTLSIGPDDWDDATALIDGATSSIELQMYLFTVDEVADRLVAAKNRGVDVRVLLDPDHDGNPDVRAQLSAAGVQVKDAPSRFEFSHAKYLVVDGDTAIVMSGNFNYDAYSEERNYAATLHDPDDVADLRAIFEADWTGGADPDLGCTRLLVSPVNSRTRILQHIASAESRLDIEAIYFSESSVRAAVVEAKNRGVAVRVMLAPPEAFDANYAAIQIMQNQDIPVKVVHDFLLHAKLILADDAALIGSQNYSDTSLSDNREVGVIVTDPAIIDAIESQYAADWAVADEP
jgi:cardiolipin synthase